MTRLNYIIFSSANTIKIGEQRKIDVWYFYRSENCIKILLLSQLICKRLGNTSWQVSHTKIEGELYFRGQRYKHGICMKMERGKKTILIKSSQEYVNLKYLGKLTKNCGVILPNPIHPFQGNKTRPDVGLRLRKKIVVVAKLLNYYGTKVCPLEDHFYHKSISARPLPFKKDGKVKFTSFKLNGDFIIPLLDQD